MRTGLLYIVFILILSSGKVTAQIDRDVVYMANILRFGFGEDDHLGWMGSEGISAKLDSMGVKKIVKTLYYPFASPPDTFLIEKGFVIRHIDTQANADYRFLRNSEGRVEQIIDNWSVTSFTFDSAGFMISRVEFTPPDTYLEPAERLFPQYDQNGIIIKASQSADGDNGYAYRYKRFSNGDSLIIIYDSEDEKSGFDYVTRIFNGTQTIFTFSDLNRQFITNRCYENRLLLEEDNGAESCGFRHEYDKTGLPLRTISHGCSNESDILIYKYEYLY